MTAKIAFTVQDLLPITSEKAIVDAVDYAINNGASLTIEPVVGGSRRIVLKDDTRPTTPWAHIRIATRTQRVCGGSITGVDMDNKMALISVTDADSAAQKIRFWFAAR